jgi:hypothetical protein
LYVGIHQHQADKAVLILGEQLLKVPAVMSDNAAKDVGAKIFTKKAEMVALLRNHEDTFTAEEMEIMSTNFVDNCITHGGDLASKRHYTSMALSMKDAIIIFNAATLLQRFVATRLIRQNTSGNIGLLCRLWSERLGRPRFHTPMRLISIRNDIGTVEKKWEVLDDIPCVYGLMTGMSSLIAHQGPHSK